MVVQQPAIGGYNSGAGHPNIEISLPMAYIEGTQLRVCKYSQNGCLRL